MPPQIKHDLNRSGWETTDFPSVCENCLPDSSFVQMLKEDHGAECKICNRPFTIFRWKADRTARQKRTNICLTCARLKNCCQCCMLDLSFGLSIPVRDAALKMIAPGPQSEVNKQYYAQEHEKEIEEGRGAVEEYEKTDEKARDLLRRLARSEPYRRRVVEQGEGSGQKALPSSGDGGSGHAGGPIRSRGPSSRGGRGGRGGPGGPGGGRGGGGRVFPSAAQLPPGPQDILPPADPNIASLFVTGIEDDLPEHEITNFFSQYGTLRSVVCSHRAHCGYVNFQTRKGAETAAEACQGKAVIAGCPLRVRWGKPKPLDNMEREQRIQYAREGRSVHAPPSASRKAIASSSTVGAAPSEHLDELAATAPPGEDDFRYASLAGN